MPHFDIHLNLDRPSHMDAPDAAPARSAFWFTVSLDAETMATINATAAAVKINTSTLANIQRLLIAMQAEMKASAALSLANQEKIMASIDDVIADVSAETTTIASIDTAIKGLQTLLATALANEVVPPAVQAKIDAVFATAEANKAALAQAVTDSVPPGA